MPPVETTGHHGTGQPRAAWPPSFGYDWGKGKPRWKLDARSDLYIHFYLHGLSLLNEKGAFCFITSNSRLDVGHGRDLQRFLLTRGQVKLVIDNQARRSFEADVNTVIVLLGAPQDARSDRKESLEHTARFVMLTVPFEELLDPIIWEEVVEASDRRTMREYRVPPARQADLLRSGMDPQKGRYTGDKWGGKYLRAPDIYWSILEKGKGKLVRLGDIAEVRFGIKTGANEFLYLDEERIRQWGIGEECLRPVIKSAKDSQMLLLDPDQLPTFLFLCHKEKRQLTATNVLRYIEWGEAQGFNEVRSVRGRRRWYDVGRKEPADAIILRRIGERCPVFEANGVLEDCVLFGITRRTSDIGLHAFLGCLNATWTRLYIETMTRQLTGAQAVSDTNVYVTRHTLIIDVAQLTNTTSRLLERRYLAVRGRASVSIFKGAEMPDRRALDDIIFDVLGLTQGERDAVYEAVINQVGARLSKARSV